MHRERILVAVLAAAAMSVGLLLAAPAAGAQAPPEGGTVMTCAPGMPPEFARTCTVTKQIDMYTPPRTNWWPFLAALAWILVPLCLAARIADSRDESVVIAVVLTLVLGWIGLLLVYAFLGRNRREDIAARRT